ncbi:MAG: ketopantoate reductase family protein [Chloroflexi bacterium]|nr:ketopantoate reductase family protein [Chloroflexota bacterium]
MRYTVFGSGAIGGTVGAHMVRGGESVLFVDKDLDHVHAMQTQGLTIKGFAETFTVPAEATTPDALPDQLETVLLACKAPATEEAVRTFANRLSPEGCVVSLQNGLNELVIAKEVGQERTLGAFVNFSADYLEPGRIHFAGRGTFVIGELDGQITPRLHTLQRALGHWGDVRLTDNIWGYLWGKQAYGAMLFATALTNDSMADAIDQHREVTLALAREVLSVARALNVTPLGFDGFEPDVVMSSDPAEVNASLDRLIAIRHTDEKTHSGVWRDLAVRKRRTEVDAHFIPIVERAEQHHLEVPLLRRMIEMIHEIEDGRRELAAANLDELAAELRLPATR